MTEQLIHERQENTESGQITDAQTGVSLESMSGDMLKEFRKRKHLKQKDLARAIGVTPSTICHWEKGVQIVKSRHFLPLREALGLNEEEADSLARVNSSQNIYGSRDLTCVFALENVGQSAAFHIRVKENLTEEDLHALGNALPRLIDKYLEFKDAPQSIFGGSSIKSIN